jgi:hypothetical protein
MPLVILIGASGSGKTTIARAIANQRADIDVRYFDSIGVPPPDQMIAEYGSGENWQRAKTIEWMTTLAPINRSGRQMLFEGQTRLAFLAEGAAAVHPCPYRPILIDCDDETRYRRLMARGQPELASPDMQNWARFLRKDAQDKGCEILDTTGRRLEDCVERVVALLP